jgi:hypothetical protein
MDDNEAVVRPGPVTGFIKVELNGTRHAVLTEIEQAAQQLGGQLLQATGETITVSFGLDPETMTRRPEPILVEVGGGAPQRTYATDKPLETTGAHREYPRSAYAEAEAVRAALEDLLRGIGDGPVIDGDDGTHPPMTGDVHALLGRVSAHFGELREAREALDLARRPPGASDAG